MKTPPSLLPDLPTLTTRLSAALGVDGARASPLTILRREPPRMMCTYPNEVVSYRQLDGLGHRVFVKYESGHGHGAYGHRGNVAYEAEVYRRLLQLYPHSRPRFFGAHTDPETGETWLVLEYLDRFIRVCDMSIRRLTRQPTAMAQAARWLGRFHAAHQILPGNGSFPFLIHYDAQYFLGWASRTLAFAKSLRHRFPWLEVICRSKQWTGPLLSAPPVIIHGEFYTKNLLFRRQKIHVVDWESAAVSAGEIDLAALTEGGWPVSFVSRCERAYQHARWPEGTPSHFRPTLEAAKIYLHFRWLGEREDWAVREKTLWRYEHLRLAARNLGIL
jgi:phosphotransferase family enzyme